LDDVDVQDAMLRLVEVDLNEGSVTNARERLSVLLATNVLQDVLVERAYRLHARALEAGGEIAQAIRTILALEGKIQDPMEIAILFALIVLNGLFAMSEISLVTARKARLWN
jgi:hypothetical protein